MRSTLILTAALFALVSAENNVRTRRTSVVAHDKKKPLLVVEADNVIAEDAAYFGRLLNGYGSMPEVRKA
jgi:hypothetical protein